MEPNRGVTSTGLWLVLADCSTFVCHSPISFLSACQLKKTSGVSCHLQVTTNYYGTCNPEAFDMTCTSCRKMDVKDPRRWPDSSPSTDVINESCIWRSEQQTFLPIARFWHLTLLYSLYLLQPPLFLTEIWKQILKFLRVTCNRNVLDSSTVPHFNSKLKPKAVSLIRPTLDITARQGSIPSLCPRKTGLALPRPERLPENIKEYKQFKISSF